MQLTAKPKKQDTPVAEPDISDSVIRVGGVELELAEELVQKYRANYDLNRSISKKRFKTSNEKKKSVKYDTYQPK